MRYKVNEVFDSIQGEGILLGTPSTFIRLQGCPVGCSWCDSGPLADEIEGKRRTNGETANTWGPGGFWATEEEIVDWIHNQHVIITGGEPVIWNLDALINCIREQGHYTIQLETSGLNALKGRATVDWVTWSPKQNLGYAAPSKLKDMAKEVKFVIDQYITPRDIQQIVDYYHYENNGGTLRAFVLMPEGCPPGPDSIQHASDLMVGDAIDWHDFPVRMGARLQYYLNMR